MANFKESFTEAVCIEEEVFFGPIADKERKIREHFENALINDNNTTEPHNNENDISLSKNDSLYQSFSVDESKYESFADSLNEELDKNLQDSRHITLRRSFDKLKSKRHGFYDSLEDVCSLASNLEKCSISCEVGNNSNLNKQPAIDDSLMNPHIALASKSYGVSEQDSLKNSPAEIVNKNTGISEQIHFDDDSLAILELESTFDDSLEEINVEIEEVDCVEDIDPENLNKVHKVEQNFDCIPKNLFDTSVEIVCERKGVSDQEESSDDKNLLYDSLSNSDFKDVLKDSLEESEKISENLKFLIHDSNAMENQNKVHKVEQNFDCIPKNLFNTSFEIVCERKGVSDQEESSDDKNLLYDSLSNSDFKDVLKDSLEESEKISENLKFLIHDSDAIANNNQKTERMFDMSVQIVYENFQTSSDHVQNVSELTNSDNDFSKDSLSLENIKNVSQNPVEKVNNVEIEEKLESHVHLSYKNSATSKKSLTDLNDNALRSDSNSNQDFKKMKSSVVTTESVLAFDNSSYLSNDNALFSNEHEKRDYKEKKDCSVLTEPVILVENLGYSTNDDKIYLERNLAEARGENYKEPKDHSVLMEPVIPISSDNNSDFRETISVNSCHLKLLNDNKIDEDLKLQRQVEVIVGDNNFQIAPENIKILPKTDSQPKKCVDDSTIAIPVEYLSTCNVKKMRDVFDECSPKLKFNAEEYNLTERDIKNEKPKSANAVNAACRAKSSRIQLTNDSNEKLNFPENISDISLFQALDLHDISSFLNESIIQSNNSLMPLNLCCRDQDIFIPIIRDEIKENIPQLSKKKKVFCTSSKKPSPRKICLSRTPIQKTSSFKDSTKKNSGTKIPVRKIENFAVPSTPANKPGRQVPIALSAEKFKRCQHSPHSADVGKKTPDKTSNKTPHYCKVRNTIFSKVPQITPSKKYMNIQSPVAQYIKNNGSGKKAQIDPVLRDCMNRPLESPSHSHHTPKSGTLKSVKKKT